VGLLLLGVNSVLDSYPDASATSEVESEDLNESAGWVVRPEVIRAPASSPDLRDSENQSGEGNRWVEGKLVFLDEAAYPHTYTALQVITESPVIAEGLTAVDRENTKGKRFFLIPVGEDSTFRFQLAPSQAMVRISAIGPGCAGVEDVEAIADEPAIIKMALVYGADVRFVDSENGLPIAVSPQLYYATGNTNWDYREECQTGVRSEIARDYLRILVGEREKVRGSRHLLVATKHFPEGIGLRVAISEPGYEKTSRVVSIPQLGEAMPVVDIPIKPISLIWSSIELSITRPGDWSESTAYDYRSISQFWICSSSSGEGTLCADAVLLPGTQVIEGIPFDDINLELEVAGPLKLLPPAGGRRKIHLTPPKFAGMPYIGIIDCSDIGAVRVPPLVASDSEYAWLGLNREDAPYIGYRYSAQVGYILDGLPLGRVTVYWGKDRFEYRSNMSQNLSLTEIEVHPGINQIILP